MEVINLHIEPKKGFSWTEAERVQLVSLLAKIGYQVCIGREKQQGKTQISIYISAE